MNYSVQEQCFLQNCAADSVVNLRCEKSADARHYAYIHIYNLYYYALFILSFSLP